MEPVWVLKNETNLGINDGTCLGIKEGNQSLEFLYHILFPFIFSQLDNMFTSLCFVLYMRYGKYMLQMILVESELTHTYQKPLLKSCLKLSEKGQNQTKQKNSEHLYNCLHFLFTHPSCTHL